MKTGTQTKTIPEHTFEVETKVCDICNADASERTPCIVCKKDLCSLHQLYITRDTSDFMARDDDTKMILYVQAGSYCKDCLIEALMYL